MSSAPPLLRQARAIQWFVLSYNVLEGLIAVGAGWAAGSIALVGFGLDSFIEVTAAAAVLWRLVHQGSAAEGAAKERRALQVVGLTFLLLAAYVLWESGRKLLQREPPAVSVVGLVVAAASITIMPFVARRQRRLAAALRSPALAADAVESWLCAALSVVLLAGIGLNALCGWWWADPVAALVMVPLMVKEGVEGLRGEHD